MTLSTFACLMAGAILMATVSTSAQPSDAPRRFAPAIQPFVDQGSIAGAVVVVADKDHDITVEAIGFADIATQTPMRPDSLVWIASMTKPITAAAVMILVDEGRIRLDDPVNTYLPEFDGQWVITESDVDHVLLRKPGRPITVRDLLTHTSGLPHVSAMEDPVFARTGQFGPQTILPLNLAARSYAIAPLQYEPGARWQYCNAGFNTAGRIVEVVSGLPFDRFLDERLFKPLGMTDTTFSPATDQLLRLAKSYRPGEEASAPLVECAIPIFDRPPDGRTNPPFPAGGLFSTGGDLARFCQMLLNEGTLDGRRVLSKAAVEQMRTRQVETNDGQPFGLGFFINPGGSIRHGGSFSTGMTIDHGNNSILIVLMQQNGFAGEGHRVFEAFDRVAYEEFWAKRSPQGAADEQ